MTPDRVAHENGCSTAPSNHIQDVEPHNQDAIPVQSEDEDSEVDGDTVGPIAVMLLIYTLLSLAIGLTC